MRYIQFSLVIFILTSCLSDTGKRDDFFVKGNQSLSNGQFKEAIEHYTNCLKVDPSFDQALNNRGVA